MTKQKPDERTCACGVRIQLIGSDWVDGEGGIECYSRLPTLRRELESKGENVYHHPMNDEQ